MRLVKRLIESDGSGSVTLYPEEPEDMVGIHRGVTLSVMLIGISSGMLTT
jgi:eRF1 domain 1